jgi:glycosyltransferase involved in cell wall biosynthesis
MDASFQDLRISVIIPARNEASNLQHVLPYIPSFVNEVILVDGHSVDGTIAMAQQLLPDICIIKQQGKGKGDAIRAGLAATTGDIIVLLDADGSADPCEIARFVDVLMVENDFAKGSRFVKGGGSHDITTLRRLGNQALQLLVNLLFKTRFTDLCYGYNACWRHCFDQVQLDCDGFEIEAMINIRMHQAGFRIAEVPSFEYHRIHGTSNLNALTDGLRVLRTILKERRKKSIPPIRVA